MGYTLAARLSIRLSLREARFLSNRPGAPSFPLPTQETLMRRRDTVALVGAITMALTAALPQSTSLRAESPSAVSQGGTPATKSDENLDGVARDFLRVRAELARTAAVNLTGDADVDFARQMVAHHQADIEMARVLLDHGKDAALRRAAEKMIVERQKEIGELQLWLQTHRP
jgi:hypothetical protein